MLRGRKTLRRTVCKAKFKVTDFLRSPRSVCWAVEYIGTPRPATFALAAAEPFGLKTLRSMRCGQTASLHEPGRRGHLEGLRWARNEGFAEFLLRRGGRWSARTVRWLGKTVVACPCGGTYHALLREKLK